LRSLQLYLMMMIKKGQGNPHPESTTTTTTLQELTFQTVQRVQFGPQIQIVGRGALQGCRAVERVEFLSMEEEEDNNEDTNDDADDSSCSSDDSSSSSSSSTSSHSCALHKEANQDALVTSTTTTTTTTGTTTTTPLALQRVEPRAFGHCTSLRTLDLSRAVLVTDLERQTLWGCVHLSQLRLPPHLVRLHDQAVQGCIRLRHLVLPSSCQRIGKRALANTGLTRLTIPAACQRLEAGALADCIHLESLTLESSVSPVMMCQSNDETKDSNNNNINNKIRIDDDVLSGCTKLSRVDVPETQETISPQLLPHLLFHYSQGRLARMGIANDNNRTACTYQLLTQQVDQIIIVSDRAA